MQSAKGYYDGNNYVIEGEVTVKPYQHFIITFLDDDVEQKDQQTDIRKKLEKMESFCGSLSHEEAEEIRNNRVNFKERV